MGKSVGYNEHHVAVDDTHLLERFSRESHVLESVCGHFLIGKRQADVGGVPLCTSLHPFPTAYWASIGARTRAAEDLSRLKFVLFHSIPFFFHLLPPPDHAHPCPRQRRQRTCPRLETLPVNLGRKNLLSTRQRGILSGAKGDQRRPQHRRFPRPRQVRCRQRGATSAFPPLCRILTLIRLAS